MADEKLREFRESWVNEINSEMAKPSSFQSDGPKLQKENVQDDFSCQQCQELQKGRPRQMDEKFDMFYSECRKCVDKASSSSVKCSNTLKPDRHICLSDENDLKINDKNLYDAKKKRDRNGIVTQQDIKRLKPNSEEKSSEENLLEILIADIDETVSLPFFDLELPREIALRIFRFLRLGDLGNCALVNKQWNILAEDDLIWYDISIKCGFDTKASCLLDREGWKNIVKECILKEKEFKKNWKERICQISELEYEKGGILYAASIFNNQAIAGYANGLIKVWDMLTENPLASLGSSHAESETAGNGDIAIDCVCMNDIVCAAGYSNGNVCIWQNGYDFPLIQRYQSEGKINCLNVGKKSASVISSSGCKFRIDTANENGTWGLPYLGQAQKHVNAVYLYDVPRYKAVITTSCTVEVHDMKGKIDELEKTICAEISCIYCTDDVINVGVTPLRYSILDGYRIKQYSSENGNLKNVLKGLHCRISCLHAADSLHNANKLAVGCSDKKIRIHNENEDRVLMSLSGITGMPCSLQIDDWKVIAGDTSGFVSVWDQRTQALLWQTRTRHPVRICKLQGPCLVTASLPLDKNPRETMWYADDLIQHRRHRGNIRIYNFCANNSTTGVPDICQSDYNSSSGYNYNINLVTPYDHI